MAANTVFLVHGRNLALAHRMRDLLEKLDLRVLDFTEVRNGPEFRGRYVGDVLDYAFSVAQAIVVIMSPDDRVSVRPQFRLREDPIIRAQFQPRPNVLIELGMALRSHPDRVVLVEFPPLREATDIEGLLRVQYKDDHNAFAQELFARLSQSGCTPIAPATGDALSGLAHALQVPIWARLEALVRNPVFLASAVGAMTAIVVLALTPSPAACDADCKLAREFWTKGHELWHQSNFQGGVDSLYVQARKLFRDAQKKQPQNLRYVTSAAATMNDLGDHQAVVDELSALVKVDPLLASKDKENGPWLLAELAAALELTDHRDESRKQLASAVKQSPDLEVWYPKTIERYRRQDARRTK